MNRLKYIMVDDPMVGPTPYIFPEWVTHANVARKIDQKVLSAGFFFLRRNQWSDLLRLLILAWS